MTLVRYSHPTYRSLAPFAFERSPWAGFESEIDRLLETAFNGFGHAAQSNFPVDLYEDDGNTYVRAELPGVNREHIGVEMVDGTLTITVTNKSAENKSGDAAAADAEETFEYTRSIEIAGDVDAEKVSAAYENGVLTVTLPKKEAARPRKIAITVK